MPNLWKSLLKLSIPILIGVIYLGLSQPFFRIYLEEPSRYLLPWDPALHVKDGLMFFLQWSRFDFLSFFYSLISLTFWLPLHPLFVATTSLFFPWNLDAYVYLNFLFMALGLSGASALINRSQMPLLTKISAIVGLLYVCLRLQNSWAFLGTHLSIMIESLGVGLTLVFATSTLLEETEPQKEFYTRTSIISISLLLFTKIQYGLFFGAAHFLNHTFKNRHRLLAGRQSFKKLWWFLQQKRAFLFILVLIFGFGLFAMVSFNHFEGSGFGVADGIWGLSFPWVLILSWIGISKEPQIRELRTQVPSYLREYSKWILVPFGWYYLFPLRNKIRWLLFNAQPNTHQPLLERFARMPGHFLDYFSLTPMQGGTLLILGAVIMLLLAKKLRQPSLVLMSLSLSLAFCFPISLFAGATMTRISITWVVHLATVLLLASCIFFQKRLLSTFIILIFGFGVVHEYIHQDLEKVRRELPSNFMSPAHEEVVLALRVFDFGKPGLIYGLGGKMDAATQIFSLEILKNHPENSSFLPWRRKFELYGNDFGKTGNATWDHFILERANTPGFDQILLYPDALDKNKFAKLEKALLSNGLQFIRVIQNPHFVFYKRHLH